MLTPKIIIFVLMSTLEINSSNGSANYERLPWKPSTLFARTDDSHENFDYFRKFPSTRNNLDKFHRLSDYSFLKNDYWLDPIEYKKFRYPKRFNEHLKKPTKSSTYSRWNIPDFEKSSFPSVYLKPPSPNNYNYYGKLDKLTREREKEDSDEKEPPKNHRLENETIESSEVEYDRSKNVVRDHDPEQKVEASDGDERAESAENFGGPKDIPGKSKDRIEFHIQGHAGPETYMFGFDTGVGENRQFRMEERHEDGTVTGHYGYVDARGKLRKVRYKASPTHGYQEKHHEVSEQET